MFSICLPVTWNLTNSIVNENPYLNSTAISLLSTSEYWISTYRDWHVYISSMSRFFHIFSLKITFRICLNLLLWCSIWYVWGIVIISTNAQEKGFIQDFSILGRQKGPSKAMIFKRHIFVSSKIYGGFCKSYCPFGHIFLILFLRTVLS